MSRIGKSTREGDLLEPPKALLLPYSHRHSRDFALQKYLLLHDQHEFLRQHLDELRPNPAYRSSMCTPSSPNPVDNSGDMSHLPGQSGRRPSGFSLPTKKPSYPFPYMSEATPDEVAVEEARLCDVNEGMKRALTELLNCETVRGDQAFRTWVQHRLMDTERELRSGRRRRSAPGP
ncbi:hypothetical protein N656DRAFT_616491 [Canariomyces notabilis]|uniref:Uncharacterized protein n=1 Tax=Canariomyces notabilis TaxID=2074819 RepID=A0AAN6TFA2_9PEZI|nr:hypothetical protein N656DRAFT_616491 [Canariomyces arenarius]